MKKRLVSILLTLCMIVSLLPTGTMAVEPASSPVCGLAEHTHDASCYIDAATMSSLKCELTEHVHTDACFSGVSMLTLNVAEIEGGASYPTLSEAVDAAASGAKIKMLANDATSGHITIAKNLSIDLNGNSLPNTTFVLSSGTISISDSMGTGEINKNSGHYDGVLITGATVTINGGGNAVSGSGSYGSGAKVSIQAGTRSGYRFSHWSSSNGGSFENAYSASTIFTMPAGNVTLTAHWTSNGGGDNSGYDYYTITATAGTGGTISTGKYVSVREGDSADFTFIPSKGYQVADVLVNGRSIGAKNSYTFTDVRADQTIHVTFKLASGHANPETGVTF